MSRIETFRGQWEFLSNFYAFDQPIHDDMRLSYYTVENCFQARKSVDKRDRIAIQHLPPAKAKLRGREVPLRRDWDSIKRAVMLDCLLQKFLHNPDLRERLLDTQGCVLVENNHWQDRYWGVCGGVGENHLGKLLMVVREVLHETP